MHRPARGCARQAGPTARVLLGEAIPEVGLAARRATGRSSAMRLMSGFLLLVMTANVRPLVAEADLVVATYNIRRIVDEPHELWKDRRPLIAACIRSMDADIIGMQEALYPQIRDMERDMRGYRWIGLGRDGGSGDEFCPIFYRSARMELVAFGHFWLSDYPQLMGSMTWGPQYPRMCTWARLRERRRGREFVVFNTHWDHEVQEAREKSALLMRERIAGLDDATPVIVLGDFNSAAGDTPAYDMLTADSFLVDTWSGASDRPELPKSGTATFNGWGEFPLGDARIDWILTRGPWTIDRVEIVTFARGGRYPSDHFPVLATLRLAR